MLKLDTQPLSGNEQFEGFTVDLLDELSKILGFKYKIRLVADGSYGSLNKQTGEWNGMIREVIDGVTREIIKFTIPNIFNFNTDYL